jgi:pyruvate dehydrogenase E1 component alpha subunit
VVFFCQNNRWALSVPLREQVAGGSVAARAAGYGMPGVQVDGNDVLAVHTAVAEAVRRGREGGGPTVVEALTYRRAPHSTSDDPTRYRGTPEEAAEEAEWAGRDPLELARRLLLAEGAADPEWLDRTDRAAALRARRHADEVAALPEPSGEEMFTQVLERPTAALREQQEEWREWHGYRADWEVAENG